METADAAGHELLTTGRHGGYLRLTDATTEGFAQVLRVHGPGPGGPTAYSVRLPLVGAFQVENALLAAGLVGAAIGRDRMADILATLEHLTGVPGRMERIGEVNGALCLVDYAHKPEALESVLDALRPFATGRLTCVFGCGGDRDTGKRPLMGAIAARKADLVIVTTTTHAAKTRPRSALPFSPLLPVPPRSATGPRRSRPPCAGSGPATS